MRIVTKYKRKRIEKREGFKKSWEIKRSGFNNRKKDGLILGRNDLA